ncbi:FNTB [Cordylochernes scorpioides]|uniref:Protein farnesyltransferase subunit beta n=1 Tax=Cordylochernes scorpioides TaxID=51811 RepID=A0ABY6KDJ8_9ARAC|nr:FNTB [Cordylochernes scorpioides]
MPGHRKRRQFKQTDAFTRGMVIGLKRAGWSIRQIAADTHLGASTVHRLWRRWLEQGNVAIYRNAGATRVTLARVVRRILHTLDHSISTRTISRRLVANGLYSCRPLRRLPLTPPNRRQRLEWCRARSTWMTEWHRVVFSDESRFCLSSDSRRVRVWPRRGERSNPAAIVERPTVRQRGIMVWGTIAYDSRSPLLRIHGTMTAQRYVDDVLRPVTLPYLQGVPNALYQQDNARPHTARISQQALQDVQMLLWPPYSPDLSPIEHVWDIIGRRLHALPQPRSEDELWQMVEREWRAIPQDAIRTLIDSLPRRVAACIAVRGGYGGGPQQDPHLAPTYAAVNALCILGTEEAFDSIDRKNLYKFLLQMKQPDGSFIMHKDGEADIRGLYCALSVASLTNILTPKLYDNTEDWIMQCQTYEGGFGGSPECEAHGGYTFCAFAALNIIEKTQKINIKSLMRWLTSRQMSYEGGFNGRTNKLVDSCYSFWQGGSFPLLSRLLLQRGYQVPQLWLMDSEALQKYVIFFCQSEYGGLCDKLQNSWDLYHTCYALSGLAVAQHCMSKKVPFLGNEHNLLNPTHPIYNIGMKEAFEAVAYFKSLPLIEEEEIIQASAAKIISGLRGSCPNRIAELESNLLPLHLRRKICFSKFITKKINSPKEHFTGKFIRNWVPNQRLKRPTPLNLAQNSNLLDIPNTEIPIPHTKLATNSSVSLIYQTIPTNIKLSQNYLKLLASKSLRKIAPSSTSQFTLTVANLKLDSQSQCNGFQLTLEFLAMSWQTLWQRLELLALPEARESTTQLDERDLLRTIKTQCLQEWKSDAAHDWVFPLCTKYNSQPATPRHIIDCIDSSIDELYSSLADTIKNLKLYKLDTLV